MGSDWICGDVELSTAFEIMGINIMNPWAYGVLILAVLIIIAFV